MGGVKPFPALEAPARRRFGNYGRESLPRVSAFYAFPEISIWYAWYNKFRMPPKWTVDALCIRNAPQGHQGF